MSEPIGSWVLLSCVLLFCVVPVRIDERALRLPNRYSLALLAFGMVLASVGSVQAASFGPLLAAATAGAAVGLFYLVIAAGGGCGMGDVKFAAALAVTMAYFAGILAVYLAVVALAVSAVRGLTRLARRQPARHPHGASLLVGAAVVGAVALMLGG